MGSAIPKSLLDNARMARAAGYRSWDLEKRAEEQRAAGFGMSGDYSSAVAAILRGWELTGEDENGTG